MHLAPIPDIHPTLDAYSQIIGRRNALRQAYRDTEERLVYLKDHVSTLEHVQIVLRRMVDMEISDVVKALDSLLTEALGVVFDDQNLSVETLVKQERGKVSVKVLTCETKSTGMKIKGESQETYGGSISKLQGVLLRILVLLRRGLRPVMVLDESLKDFDPNYASNAGRFLIALCRRLGIDILMVSHNVVFSEAAHRRYLAKRVGDRVEYNLLHEVDL